MRSKLTIPAFLAVACGLNAWAQAPAPAQMKLAIINMQEVIVKTNDGKKAIAELQAKIAPKEQDIQKRGEELQRKQDELRKTENTISDDKKAALARDIDSMTKSLTRDRDDAIEDANQEQQKVLNELGGKIMQVLNKYSADKGFTMVFDVSGQPNNILFASNAIDITRDIVAMYDAQPPATTVAPSKPPAASTTSAPPPAKRPAAPAAAPK